MNKNIDQKLVQGQELSNKVARVLQHRLQSAQDAYGGRVKEAVERYGSPLPSTPTTPWEMFWKNPWESFWATPAETASTKVEKMPFSPWQNGAEYWVDFAQRSILFLDTLRQRGNNFIEHQRAGSPPVLSFDYETVMDARTFEQPVNYALVRIVPPAGIEVGQTRRPYVIIDPRAGHGPGIGGFKDDSQVGVALRGGHPVYFVIFFPEPEPGQTLLDVCAAEAQFVRKVRELHPDSPKPVLVGNCQGGWAAMMLAASNPEDTGPIVINGAPMSYWGGAWSEGEGDNPMRYAGGLLGGSWLASYTADSSDGIFDGAWLVQNFEELNPANTFWGKYYNLFAKVDSEAPRFLEFERWWGGFYLMSREEIEWIVQNLFIGNRIWSGEVKDSSGLTFDLRALKSPIILFASMGDNITPPQQAFNWVADVYGSTEEIKARGQTIVGLLHQDVGHLGIFVSGKVAKREHTQIVSALKSIETLSPGLYGMQILEQPGADGGVEYDVQFVEHRLEELTERLNRFQRVDEKPFEALAAISEFNQRAYELFAQPLVQAMANTYTAKLARDFHPLRLQRWVLSDINPWLAWVAPAAEAVRAQRRTVEPDHPLQRLEALNSELVNAGFDYYRDVRDAMREASFFQVYGNLFSLYLADKHEDELRAQTGITDPRELPLVQDALASIAQGGYAEAVARVAYLLQRKGEPLPLSLLQLRQDLIEDYRELLPDTTPDQQRRLRVEQEIIADFEREQAIKTLPQLLADGADRERFLLLLERVMADERVQRVKPTSDQVTMLKRIRQVLGAETLHVTRRTTTKKTAEG